MVSQKQLCTKRAISVIFDLYKAFDLIESSHKSDLYYPKYFFFLHACATWYGLPSKISTKRLMSYLLYFYIDPETKFKQKSKLLDLQLENCIDIAS